MAEFKIAKLDDEKMLVFGYASVSVKTDGATVVDSHGDTIEPDTLETAAYDYVLRSRDAALMHERRGVARLVESFAITPSKLTAMGLPMNALPQGLWVGFKVDDPAVWKRIKAGELRAFSIGGKARREGING